ncbi:hypothetical protein D3C81_956090 [compost metagenome]
MRFHRRQAAEFEEAVVPEFEDALGADHGHALGQVVHRALQQPRLLRQGLFAAIGLALLHLGDIGVEDHQPAFAGRPLADLHPAAVVQAVEGALLLGAAVLLDHQPGADRQALHLGETHAAADAVLQVAPQRLEAAVEQQDALPGVEQHEGVGDALDGVDQVLVGGFGPPARLAEQRIAGLQLGHRPVQRVGALAHLLGQHHRVLEGGVGVGALRTGGLDALDQRGVDPFQLEVARFQLGEPDAQLSGTGPVRVGRWRRR